MDMIRHESVGMDFKTVLEHRVTCDGEEDLEVAWRSKDLAAIVSTVDHMLRQSRNK